MNLDWAIPPELWALAGVIIGTLIPAVMAWSTGRQQAKHESNRMLIDSLERRIADLESSLRAESAARSSLEDEVRTRESEAREREEKAYAATDRARLAMSMAIAHITRLSNHIESGDPPPPPPLPTEVEEWVSKELWTSKLPEQGSSKMPH
ncbi:hypothetical protein [Rothia mucilaginosa]|uniref:hypothetical protein n=1 Tax=Rothia mucilaginosa TaxID=43675 RepID=UPI002889A45D|nr:hypothetical protein [Rothia mucilaginosa]